MDLGLNEKVVLLSASSSGLGLASAMRFAQEGAHVVISGRDGNRLDKATEELKAVAKNRVLAVQADVCDTGELDNLATTVIREMGTVHVLINNAGGPPPGKFEDLPDSAWQEAFNLTLMSTVRLTRAVLPCMRKQGWGRIVNITSMTVKQPVNELLLSNSLRLGVLGWAKTLSNQVAAENILVNNVCPGWTRTGRVTGLLQARAESSGSSAAEEERKITAAIPMGRLGTVAEFASLVAFLGSECASYITGTAIQVDGGLTAGYL